MGVPRRVLLRRAGAAGPALVARPPPPPGGSLPAVRLRRARDTRPVSRVRHARRHLCDPMKRLLLNLLTALSLLLCVAACVLWVRSYWVPEEWSTAYPLPGKHLAGDYRAWERHRYVASSRGRWVFLDNDVPAPVYSQLSRAKPPVGYRRGTFLGDMRPDSIGIGIGGATPKGR